VIGHQAGDRLSVDQPTKLAAIELADETEGPASLAIGGVLIDGERRYSVDVPRLGSLLARSSLDAPVQGLDEFPADDRPRDSLATLVHWSFQGMVAGGICLVVLGVVFWVGRQRGHDLLERRWFLRLAVLAGPVAIACLELGWVTTEVGRQPWIVYRIMRVEEAVTTSGGVWVSLVVLVLVYAAMAAGAVVVLRSMARRWREGAPLDLPTPYGPPGPHGGEERR
jgi:cytochrome d ubiquinol oxidase subunit I